MASEDIRKMADEVAGLMAARFGGQRRGQRRDLAEMIRKKGAAMPRRLRREARFLAWADAQVGQPKLARQVDFMQVLRAYDALVSHLEGLGQSRRLWCSVLNVAATVAFGLLLAGAAAIWILLRRGYV